MNDSNVIRQYKSIKKRLDQLKAERPEAIKEGIRAGFILVDGEKTAVAVSSLLKKGSVFFQNMSGDLEWKTKKNWGQSTNCNSDWLIILGQ